MKAKFIKAVDSGDVQRARLFLANELMLDPRGRSFNEMLDYAQTHLAGLFESSDGKEYSQHVEEWNKDFLFQLKNDLEVNFSKERIEFYAKVAKCVLRDKAEQLNKEEEEQKNKDKRRHENVRSDHYSSSSKKKAYAGVTAGGVVLTVAGLCAQKAVLASLGVAGIVIGGVLLYKESQK